MTKTFYFLLLFISLSSVFIFNNSKSRNNAKTTQDNVYENEFITVLFKS